MKSLQLLPIAFVIGGTLGSVIAFYWPSAESLVADESLELDRGSALSDAGIGDGLAETALAEPTPILSGIETFDTRVATAYAFKSNNRRAWEIERLFEDMTLEEAPVLLAMIMANEDYNKPYGVLGPFFAKWAELDGAVAFEAATALEGRDKKDAFKYLFPAWGRSNPQAAWATVLEIPGRPNSDIFRSIASEYAKQDPSAVMAKIAEDPTGQHSGLFRSSLTWAAAESGDMPSMIAKVGELDRNDANQKWMGSLYQAWASKDSDAVLEHIVTIVDPEESRTAMNGLMVGWASSDHNAALEYALANRDDPAVESSISAVFSMVAIRGTSAERQNLVATMEAHGVLERDGPILASALTYQDPVFAMELANKIQDEGAKAKIQRGAISALSQQNLDAAQDQFAGVDSIKTKAVLVPILARQISRRSDGGERLAGIFESFPKGAERTASVERLVLEAARESFRKRSSQDYLTGLALLSEQEDGLTEEAQAARAKLSNPPESEQ